jgi:ADP-heptose:LPS heptosyltransferase
MIEFDFFHVRSSLGQLDRTEADYEDLRNRLALQRFDLAVDLRKHPETRPVLQYTGARYLAGFDHRDRFPWLDVGLDWSGDQAFARKQRHTADDLVNLADAIAAACEGDRVVITATPAVSEAVAKLRLNRSGHRPLICVHPTAGNEMKQWPPEFFAAVIDQLVEEDGAQIVLIGAPGEEETAGDIIARVRRPKLITSLVGKLDLSDLPVLLTQVSLFLGNDSGPKHIAAGLGIPTVGVHAGTVDPREWGPIGPRAVAVAREVVCTPCYLAILEDCHRGLACMRQLSPEIVYRACKRLLLLGAEAAPSGRAAKADPPARRKARTALRSDRIAPALHPADG